MEKNNESIRKLAKENGVMLWQIADCLGMSDANFSRKLRHELPSADREEIIKIIEEISRR